jgi:hypothetical protein
MAMPFIQPHRLKQALQFRHPGLHRQDFRKYFVNRQGA